MQKQWTISSNGIEHTIVYLGSKLSGNIKVLIDGAYYEYVPTFVKKIGMIAKLDIPDKNVILQVSLNGKDANLTVDGSHDDDWISVDDQINLSMSSKQANSNAVLQKKIKTGFGSFLSFVLFTYLNLLLIVLNVSLSFPFSAMVPQIPLVFGKLFYEQYEIILLYIVGGVVSILLASVFLLLFFLSKKRIIPIYITIIFIIIDTVVLFLIGNIMESLIDLAFHVWVIWSIINLLKSKLELSRILEDELLNSGIINM